MTQQQQTAHGRNLDSLQVRGLVYILRLGLVQTFSSPSALVRQENFCSPITLESQFADVPCHPNFARGDAARARL
jgi:hypothetical protein